MRPRMSGNVELDVSLVKEAPLVAMRSLNAVSACSEWCEK